MIRHKFSSACSEQTSVKKKQVVLKGGGAKTGGSDR